MSLPACLARPPAGLRAFVFAVALCFFSPQEVEASAEGPFCVSMDQIYVARAQRHDAQRWFDGMNEKQFLGYQGAGSLEFPREMRCASCGMFLKICRSFVCLLSGSLGCDKRCRSCPAPLLHLAAAFTQTANPIGWSETEQGLPTGQAQRHVSFLNKYARSSPNTGSGSVVAAAPLVLRWKHRSFSEG